MREMSLSISSSSSGGGPPPAAPTGRAAAIQVQLEPIRTWLATVESGVRHAGAARAVAEVVPRARNYEDVADCLHGACEAYWWLLRLASRRAASSAGNGAPPQPPAQRQSSWRSTCTSEAAAMRPDAIRRLGGVLNELGQLHLHQGQLRAADTLFTGGLAAFNEVNDAANAALLLLNRAAVARQHAHHFAHAANGSGELTFLLEVVGHQRAARQRLKQQRGGGSAPLRAMIVRDLAAGEAAAGACLHAIVAEGGGTEASVKKAGECLSNAQALYEEIGELAQVQLLMRQQGSLYLAAALCASLEGEGHERAATSRLTLALRHYERALAPQLLAQASVSPAMERCAAEARVELATFYLTWGAGGAGGAAIGAATRGGSIDGTMGSGERVKHLETALSHARVPGREGSSPGLPTDVLAQLAGVEQSALRELIRAHAAAGNATRAATLKAEYRTLLTVTQAGTARAVVQQTQSSVPSTVPQMV